MRSTIGLTILKNLGLTEEEAERLEKQRPQKRNTVFARDRSGLGFKKPSTNYIADANDVFANLSARFSSTGGNVLSDSGTSYQSKRFIPKRLRKKSIGSLSNEDLAAILCEPDEISNVPASAVKPTTEEKKPSRKAEETKDSDSKKHHHHHHRE